MIKLPPGLRPAYQAELAASDYLTLTDRGGDFRRLLGPDVKAATLKPAPLGLSGLVEDGIHYLARRIEDYVDGRHFTEYIEPVKRLRRECRFEEAERLLLAVCDAMESGNTAAGIGIAPWWYEQLAIIYRRQKRTADEIAVLERCALWSPGGTPKELAGRLRKCRDRLAP